MIEKTIKKLIELKKTISTMESCSGGALANTITNIPDASKIFSFGAVTYSNEYKIKMGVDKNIIDTYSVYSMQTANEMSKKISMFTSSDFGVGITGKLNKKDPNNLYGNDNKVYISVYDRKNDTFYNKEVTVNSFDRKENKDYVLNEVFSLIYGLL